MKFKFTFLLCCMFSLGASYAQPASTGNWFIYFGSQAINKKWNWWNEVQYRNYNFAGDMEQLLLRTGIGMNLTENNNNLLLGYGFIRSQNYIPGTDEKASSHEHRIYQQFITKQQFSRLYLQHRYRMEERFIENDDKLRLRFRYFLSANVPLNKPAMNKGAFYLSAYNEVFLNTRSSIFDRNRLYGALGYVISKDLKAELGFMNQSRETTGRNQFMITFFNSLPLYRD